MSSWSRRWGLRRSPQASTIRSDLVFGRTIFESKELVHELYRPARSPAMQILFFPGFPFENNSALSNLQSEDGSCFWPQAWLPEEFPDAHILAITSSAGALDTFDIAKNIISDVLHEYAGQVPGCPLVLVGQSFGGLMIKSLCSLAHEQVHSIQDSELEVALCKTFLHNLRGIFYYATPHHGSSAIANLYMKNSIPSPTMQYCKILNDGAELLNAQFEMLSSQYEWQVAAYEKIALPNLDFYNDIIVPEGSVRTGESHAIVAGADHSSIIRPKSKMSRSFTELTHFLHIIQDENSDWESRATSVIRRNDNFQLLPRNIVNIGSQLHEISRKLEASNIVGLVGMGGSGKTTLAKAVFNEMCPKFEYSCFVHDMKMPVTTMEEAWKHMHYHGRKVSKGATWFELRRKTLLLVLDGISDECEKQVVPWLVKLSSSKSRFIVTSRDAALVRHLGADVYKVPLLDDENARQLFASHAFLDPNTIPLRLGPSVDAFVKKCQGLALALKVCGRHLRGKKSEQMWEQTLLALNGLAGSGLDEIWATLRISYDNLSYPSQRRFLDAATFFTVHGSWTLGKAKEVWKKAYHTDASLVWQHLVDRSLVDDVEEDDHVKVHELLRSLGKRISDEPGNKGSRWDANKQLRLLGSADDLDDQYISAPRLHYISAPIAYISAPRLTAEGDDRKDSPHTSTTLHRLNKKQDLEVSIPVTIHGAKGLEDFSDVEELVDFADLGGLNVFSDSSGGLDEPASPAESDDSKDSKDTTSRTSTTLHRRNKKEDLEVSVLVTLDGANGLEDFSDFGRLNTAKRLLITKFPGSSLLGDTRQLVALQQLQIQDCSHVKELPDSIGKLINLKRLVILNCPSLSMVPETLGSLTALWHLRIQDCEGLKDLPGTLGRLCGLEELIIWNCSGLTKIPDTIGQLGALRHLLVHGCKGLEGLPQSLGQLESLEHLVVSNNPRLTELRLPIGQLWCLKHLQIQDCESLEILPETLKQVEALEYVTISNCSNVSTFLTAYGDELLEARAPASHGRLTRSPAAEQLSTSVKSFIAALETEGRDTYLVSTEWLLGLQDYEQEILASICVKTGYRLTYRTTSNTYYQRYRTDEHVQNINTGNDVSTTDVTDNFSRPGDDATSSGVSQIIGDLLTDDLQSLHIDERVDISGSSGVLNSTEEGMKSEDIQTCDPKYLQVDCSASEDFSETLLSEVSARRPFVTKEVGDCSVTFPDHVDLTISTVVEKNIRMPFYKFSATKQIVKESVSLRVFVETTVSCCLRNDDNPKKVHVEISRIRGEIKYVDTAEPRNHDLFLQCVRTNVRAGIDHGDRYESIRLRFREVVGATTLSRSGINPKMSRPGSTTVELQCPVERTREIRGDQGFLFDDEDHPATLEGAVRTSLSQESVLEVDIRYQLGLTTDEPCEPMPTRDRPFCGIISTFPVIDFGCIIKTKTRDLLVS